MQTDQPRVLLLCSRLPTQVQGGVDLRVRNQILALLNNGPTGVFALTGRGKSISPDLYMWRSANDPKMTQEISPLDVLAKIVSEGAQPYWNKFSEQTARELHAAIVEFEPDIVVICRLSLAPYIGVIRNLGVSQILLDLDETTADVSESIGSIISNRGYALFHSRYSEALVEYEKEVISLVDGVWLSSSTEVEKFARRYPNFGKLTIVPSAINTHDYQVNPKARIPHRLLFTANFSYEPNLDAVRFIIDRLLPKLPDASVDLVGSQMVKWIDKIDHARINVVGPVRNIAPYFTQSSMMILPLRAGGGTRLKALEAMASGLPIVSTSLGVEGLGLVNRQDVLIAETPEDFADACLTLETDLELRAHLIQNAIDCVHRTHSLPALCNVLKSAMSSK